MTRCALLLAFLETAAAVLLSAAPEGHDGEYRQKQFNIEDLQYYSLVTVGQQVLHGVMDTGSTELIVISDLCKQECGESSRLYHPRKSRQHRVGKFSQVLSYGSGDLVGKEGYDTFSIGPFKSQNQPFWEIVDAKMPLLLHSDFEVIVGLGPIDAEVPVMKYGADNERAYAGELENLNISRYGFCLMQDFGAPGYIIWNDESIHRTPQLFTEVHLAEPGYWMARLSNVRLGDRKIACESNCGAILDSGTSLLALPRTHYVKLAHAIHRLGAKCDDISNLPNLYFELDGHDFFLPPDAYLGEVEGLVSKQMSRHFHRSRTACREALMHVNMESSFGATWVLGMPFFRSFYTVFEQGPRQKMYMAKANSKCEPTSGKEMELYVPSRRTARKINAAKLRFSPGVERRINFKSTGRVVSNGTRARLLAARRHRSKAAASVSAE